MPRRHRLIIKALASLGWTWESEENPIYQISDIDQMEIDTKKFLDDIEMNISDLEESKEICISHLENIKTLKNQIEIEEYKELNPGRDIFKV